MPSPRRRAPLSALAPLAVPLLAAAVLSAGCGGDDGDRVTAGAASASDWIEELGRRCVELNEDHAPLATAAPDDADAAVEHAEGVERAADGLEDAVGARVSDPEALDGGGRTLEELRDGAGELADAAGELADAARDGDADRARDAVEDVRAAGERVNEATAELDLPACGGF